MALRLPNFLRRKPDAVPVTVSAPVEDMTTKAISSEWERIFLAFKESAGLGRGVSRPYEQHSFAYTCINRIATNISQVPLVFYRGADLGARVDTPDPLRSFGQGMTLAKFLMGTVVWLELSGEAFWYIEKLGRESLVHLWGSRDVFEVVEGGRLVAWRISWGSSQRRVQLDEISHPYYFNPYNRIRGLSPLKAAQMALDQDYWAQQYNSDFFQNNAEPGGILAIKQAMTGDNFKRFVKGWENRHQGQGKRQGTAFVNGSEVDYQSFGTTKRDAQFIESRRFSREEIMGILGVPPAECGVYEYANYANSESQARRFWLKTLFPKMDMLEDELNRHLLPRLNLGHLVAAFDRQNIPDLSNDWELLTTAAERLVKIGFSPAEVNGRLGLGFDRDKRRDTILVQTGLTPIEQAGQANAPAEPASGGKSGPAADPDQTPRPTKIKALGEPGEIWRAIVALAAPLEGKAGPVLSRYFFGMRKAVLRALETVGPRGIEGAVAWDEFDALLLERMSPLHKAMATAGAKHACAVMGISFDLGNLAPIIATVTADREIKVKTINQTIRAQVHEQIRELTQAATQEGWSMQRLADEVEGGVKGLFNQAANRSMTIARTETMSVMNQTTRKVWQAHGAEKTAWITARDEKVRPSHQIEGEERRLSEKFSNGLRFPCDPAGNADEVINCRCTTVPVFDDEGNA